MPSFCISKEVSNAENLLHSEAKYLSPKAETLGSLNNIYTSPAKSEIAEGTNCWSPLGDSKAWN